MIHHVNNLSFDLGKGKNGLEKRERKKEERKERKKGKSKKLPNSIR